VVLKYTSERLQIIKSYYTGIGKTGVIYPAAFLVALAVGALSLGAIFYVREVFHATPGQVGVLSALWSLSYIAGCLLVRPRFDRVPPRYLLILSTGLMFCSSAALLLLHSFASFTALYCFCGMSMSLFWPPLMGWLAKGMEGRRLGSVMGRYNFSWSAGIIASPYLSGFLSEHEASYPLYLCASLLLFTCILLAGASLALPKIREEDEEGAIELVGDDARETARRTLLRFPGWVGLFTSFAAIGIVLNIFPVSARADLGMGKGTIGLLLEARIVFVTVGFVIMGRTSFWHFRPLPMLLGQAFLVIVLVCMVFTRQAALFGALVGCVGFCQGVSFFYSMFHGISGSVNRAGMMALHESLLSAGLITGSSAGGYVYQHSSMGAVYGGCAFLVLIGLVAQAILSKSAVTRERATLEG
jgi:DHA1 family multidrug resistance protein-like MFS transporter/DHA1 family quinolone resistance protein-like MFS transporter